MKSLIEENSFEYIIYEDHELIVVNKPATIPIQRDQTSDESLLRIIEKRIGQKLFLVNRIDRPVSGLVLIAKNSKAQTKYASLQITKRYIAISHKNENLQKGTFEHYHARNGRIKKAYISETPRPNHKLIKLTIEEIHPLQNYDVIKLSIISGRFHQIRAQLSHLGSPIKGDVKYGARRANKDRSIMLHAYEYVLEGHDKPFRVFPNSDNSLWKETILRLEDFNH